MAINLCGFWRTGLKASTVCVVLLGCNSKPPAHEGAANRPPLPKDARPSETSETATAVPIDSPAFASPEEAVQAWVKAYQQEGEEGHHRMTFDQLDVPDEQWQKTLAEGYAEAAKAGEVQVLETLTRENAAAVIVRLGERVDRFALYKDAQGWHLCRTLRNWDAVKVPTEYRLGAKAIFNLGADASVAEIEWRKKLSSSFP